MQGRLATVVLLLFLGSVFDSTSCVYFKAFHRMEQPGAPHLGCLHFASARRVLLRLRGGEQLTEKHSESKCAWCAQGKETQGVTLRRCSWCRSVVYCSTDCQALDWRTHQNVCPPGIKATPEPPANDYIRREDTQWQRPLRVQKRMQLAESIRDDTHGMLPKGWSVCSSCRLPVLPEWLDCPSCTKPISEEEEDCHEMPYRQRIEMQSSGHVTSEPLKLLLRGAETGNITMLMDAVGDGAEVVAGDPDLYNSTALHYAAGRGHVEATKLLLKMGAAVDQTNVYGEAALHWAAEEGRQEVVEVLLDAGGDGGRENDFGQRVVDLAAEHGHMALVRWMRARGYAEGAIQDWERHGRPEGVEQGELLSQGQRDSEDEQEIAEAERRRKAAEAEDAEEEEENRRERALEAEEDPYSLLSEGARDTVRAALQENEHRTKWERRDDLVTRRAADGSVYSVPRREGQEGELAELMRETLRVQREIEEQGGDTTPVRIDREREYVRLQMRKARDDFEWRLREREAMAERGVEDDELPAVLPIAPEYDLQRLQPPTLEEEEGKQTRAGGKRSRRGEEDESEDEEVEEDGGRAGDKYMEAIQREMEKAGGADNVPLLSNFLREMEARHPEDDS